ncbi:MAG: adenine deaminase [Bacillota bacterium]|nr:adenine deaminase [Bacillota bacterium]
MENLKNKITKARGLEKPDLVFKNVKVIDVFSSQIIPCDLALDKGQILGFGSYAGKEEVDLGGRYICPTLIDSHIHIESSMLSPSQLAKILLANGVGTIIADPHEIGNVLGLRGIDYILSASEGLPLDVRLMLPSCVPCTPFENSGARLSYQDLEKYKNKDRVLGLGEMMDYVGLLNEDEEILKKICSFSDRIIDGHSPGLMDQDLNAYVLAGIKTDHESSSIEEMNQRLARGMYLLIRQGTAAQNAEVLSKNVNKDNVARCLFCTDDKHPADLEAKGSINENIKIAIRNGVDPIDAIKMATINPALCYGLKNKGALAPGYEGSFIVLEGLEDFKISDVYIRGQRYFGQGKLLIDIKESQPIDLIESVKIYPFKEEDFQIPLRSTKARVIGVNKGDLITDKLIEEVPVVGAKFLAQGPYLKLAVIERHKGLKSMGLGIIKNLGIKAGAIGSTIAHDSHNLIIVGANDRDMYLAMKEIERIQGGLVLVKDGKVLASLALEIGGIMSNKSLHELRTSLDHILKLIKTDLGGQVDPLLTLAFMALPVIPHLKLTDKGLFDVDIFDFVDINV